LERSECPIHSRWLSTAPSGSPHRHTSAQTRVSRTYKTYILVRVPHTLRTLSMAPSGSTHQKTAMSPQICSNAQNIQIEQSTPAHAYVKVLPSRGLHVVSKKGEKVYSTVLELISAPLCRHPPNCLCLLFSRLVAGHDAKCRSLHIRSNYYSFITEYSLLGPQVCKTAEDNCSKVLTAFATSLLPCAKLITMAVKTWFRQEIHTSRAATQLQMPLTHFLQVVGKHAFVCHAEAKGSILHR
jgi:hypothetical protein